MNRILLNPADEASASFLFERPETDRKLPCVLFIHGGGWSSGSAEQYRRHMKAIVEAGGAAASAEYRLKTDRLPLEACVADCGAIMRYLRSHADSLGLLPDRLCAAGESAGGHLALCLASPLICPDPAVRPDLVVNLNGVVDMTGVFRDRFFPEEKWQNEEDADSWLGKYELAERWSPLYRVSSGNSPALHLQGLADPVVRPAETLRYHRALREAGVESELILLPCRSHAFILYDYENTDDTVNGIVDMLCGKLAERGYLNTKT